MKTLHHDIKIAAPCAAVYRALTTPEEMAVWHKGQVEGDIAPGRILTLTPKPGLRFGWRTDQLEPDRLIAQTCVEGPGNSRDKTLTLTLSEPAPGVTQVTLADGEWQEDDPHLPFCNSYWGAVLYRLKIHAEKK